MPEKSDIRSASAEDATCEGETTAGSVVVLTLPWPPSANHYYRHVGPRVLISKEGRRYRDAVLSIAARAAMPTFRAPVEVEVELFPPDRRRRDVDNSLKCALDSLTHAGVYEDDSLIRRLTVAMREPRPPRGMAIVRISEQEEEHVF